MGGISVFLVSNVPWYISHDTGSIVSLLSVFFRISRIPWAWLAGWLAGGADERGVGPDCGSTGMSMQRNGQLLALI
jgi:hypothetical protein